MALLIDTASTSNIVGFGTVNFPIVRPFSIGMWVRCNATTTATFFCLTDTATTNNYHSIRQSTTWGLVARGGGTENSVTGGTVTTGRWAYLVARFITATNDRMSVLEYNGTVTSLNRTTTRSPTSLDNVLFSALQTTSRTEPFAGSIAEFWIANKDIQPDALALSNDTLRTLAYRGPFAVPTVAQSVCYYTSLLSLPPGDSTTNDGATGNLDEIYAPFGVGTNKFDFFINTGLGRIGITDHPPRASNFVTPSAYAAMTLT